MLPRRLAQPGARDGRHVSTMEHMESTPMDPAERRQRWLRMTLPAVIGVLTLIAWDLVVRLNNIPHYILPGPLLVANSLWNDWGTLWPALLVTVRITFMALAVAVIGGVGLALLFAQSKW